MKFLFLIWSGIWRKRTRAALILLQAIDKAHANRMYVFSRVS